MTDAALLATLPVWAFAFVLVLARCSTAVMILPGLGEAEPPAMMRVGLSLALTALVLPQLPAVPAAADGWRAAGMVVAEILCGAVLGWLARCVAMALPMAGQVISFMLGLSSVLAPDAVLGQSSALMRLFSLAVPVLVLGTGLWAMPVMALAGSYDLVPAGTLLPAAEGTQAAVGAVADAFGLALRLAAPFVFASVVWQVAVGMTAKLIPRLQIYFAAMPAQIAGGVALLGLLASGLAATWTEAAHTALARLPGL